MDLRVTYDKSVDALYLYLREQAPGIVGRTVEVKPAEIMLDFDKDDRLIGIEVLYARRNLPKEIWRNAEQLK